MPGERVTFENSRGHRLVGTLYPENSTAAVVLAHGFTSDRESRGRFPRLAAALNASAYAALAFDFAGCGESDDDALTLDGQVADLTAAIGFVHELGYRNIGLAGISLGALICFHAVSPDIATIVAISGATGPVIFDWFAYFNPEQLDEWRATGFLTIANTTGSRAKVRVRSSLLDEFAKIDQSTLFSKVHCPALLIHGDGDEEERQLLRASRLALPMLPEESRLDILHGASHGLNADFDTVIAIVGTWIRRHLPRT